MSKLASNVPLPILKILLKRMSSWFRRSREHRVGIVDVDRLLAVGPGAERTADRRRQLRARVDDAGLDARPGQALEVAADAHAATAACRSRASCTAAACRCRCGRTAAASPARAPSTSGSLLDDLAVVRHRPAGGDAAAERRAARQPDVHRRVEAVPVTVLVAVVGRERDDVLRRRDERRADVVDRSASRPESGTGCRSAPSR